MKNSLIIATLLILLNSCHQAWEEKEVSLPSREIVLWGSTERVSTRSALQTTAGLPSGEGVFVGVALMSYDLPSEYLKDPYGYMEERMAAADQSTITATWANVRTEPAIFCGAAYHEVAYRGQIRFRSRNNLMAPSVENYNGDQTTFIRAFYPVIRAVPTPDYDGQSNTALLCINAGNGRLVWTHFDGSYDIMAGFDKYKVATDPTYSHGVWGSTSHDHDHDHDPAPMLFKHLCTRFNFRFRTESLDATAVANGLQEVAQQFGNIYDVQLLDHHQQATLDLWDASLEWSTPEGEAKVTLSAALNSPLQFDIAQNGFNPLPITPQGSTLFSEWSSFSHLMLQPGLKDYTLRIVCDGELIREGDQLAGYVDVPFTLQTAPEAGSQYNIDVTFNRSWIVKIEPMDQTHINNDQTFD